MGWGKLREPHPGVDKNRSLACSLGRHTGRRTPLKLAAILVNLVLLLSPALFSVVYTLVSALRSKDPSAVSYPVRPPTQRAIFIRLSFAFLYMLALSASWSWAAYVFTARPELYIAVGVLPLVVTVWVIVKVGFKKNTSSQPQEIIPDPTALNEWYNRRADAYEKLVRRFAVVWVACICLSILVTLALTAAAFLGLLGR